MSEVKDLVEGVNRTFNEYKQANDERLEKIEKGLPTSDLDQKLARMDEHMDQMEAKQKEVIGLQEVQMEVIERIEAQKSAGMTLEQKQDDEHMAAFEAFIRSAGKDLAVNGRLKEAEAKSFSLFEGKEVNIGTPAAGGYAVPKVISNTIELLEAKFSPVRRLVRVVQVSTSDYKELVDIRGTSAGWVGEQGPRPETNTAQLREVSPTMGELYAYPQSSEWATDDMFFNVQNWLATNVAQEFALAEGDAVIRGDGSNKPTGMLNTAPSDVSDEAGTRTAAQYESVTVSGTTVTISMDNLIDLVYKTNSIYRANGVWTMNSNTTAVVRKLKSTNGDYYWQPSLQAGQPASLLGYAVETWEQMDDIATTTGTTHPIAFGDFNRGYILTDRVGLRITVDNVTNIGFIRWYIRRREGGHVLNNNAIKWLKTTDTGT